MSEIMTLEEFDQRPFASWNFSEVYDALRSTLRELDLSTKLNVSVGDNLDHLLQERDTLVNELRAIKASAYMPPDWWEPRPWWEEEDGNDQ
jgi:hypothetical protein